MQDHEYASSVVQGAVALLAFSRVDSASPLHIVVRRGHIRPTNSANLIRAAPGLMV